MNVNPLETKDIVYSPHSRSSLSSITTAIRRGVTVTSGLLVVMTAVKSSG